MENNQRKFHLLVLGCQMNRADAERIEKILLDLGWQKTKSEIDAELIILVACSVRQAAIDRAYGKAAIWRRRRKKGELKTILTGCVLEADKKKMSKIFDQVIDISEIGRLPEILDDSSSLTIADYLCLPAQHESKFSAYVPISNGCNNFCAYCAVPYTRGREVSRDAASIISECKKLIASGYKEIFLLGQNVNSYKSGSYDFPKILSEIDQIKGDFWVRFLTSHPKDLSDDLIEVMACGQHITPYLHLALQSGDDEILKKMNRHYTSAQYKDLIIKARKKISGLAVSTDIIVGFPGESREQFNHTATLMQEVGFDMAYLGQYSPRPQTVAAKLPDDVAKSEKKRRWEELNEILKTTALAANNKMVGKKVRVLVDGWRDGNCFAKTANFKIISFPGDKSLVGQFAEIKVTGADTWSLTGEMA